MHENAKNPKVWVLLGQKGGDNAQIRNLAQLLEWPHAEKQLYFNEFSRRPNILLGPTLFSIKESVPPLEPPWPDLLIAAGKRSVPAARWVKKRSGGRTKLVHMGRPWGPLDWFDLIVTTPQYRLPRRPNVIHNTLPIIRHDPQRLREEVEKWSERLSPLPRPWIALLAGGPSRPFTFDARTGESLGRAASSFAREHGGSLLVTAGRRCPPASFQALAGAVDCPSHVHDPHDPSQENPYFAYLSLADMFVVTCDSASMIAEACLMRKPVFVFDLPVKYDRKMRTAEFLRSILLKGQDATPGLGAGIYEFLVEYGLLTSTRDLRFYNDVLRQKGLIARFGEKGDFQASALSNRRELEIALAEIKSLLE
jgi:mitochondrial fission protein ELM1